MTDREIVDFGRRCAERVARKNTSAANANSFARSHLCRIFRYDRGIQQIVEIQRLTNLPLPPGLVDDAMTDEGVARVCDLLCLGIGTLPGDDGVSS